MNAKRQALSHFVDESDRGALVAGVVDLQHANPRAIVNGGELIQRLAPWTEAATFVWLLTEEILSEYLEVLERMNVRSASKIVALIREEGRLVRTVKRIAELPDPDDAAFCECVESGNADFIVTLNPSDFPQSRLKAKVIAPTEALPPRRRQPRPRGMRLVVRKK